MEPNDRNSNNDTEIKATGPIREGQISNTKLTIIRKTLNKKESKHSLILILSLTAVTKLP
ncbi:hypothetical protein Hanom_Chr09g00761591 [Helianthus anomalus]